MVRIQLFQMLLILCCGYGLIWGGRPERYAVIIIMVGFLLTIAVAAPVSERFSYVEVRILLVDTAMLASFFYLALNAERFWTIWLCAMQSIQVLTHLPIIIIPELLPQAYGAVAAIWAYPMLIVLAIGTYRHQQRLRQFGADRSWSDFSSLPK
ncbi:hypothetical protein [uncultured Parasphingorhabdus sp.]|uniref:hypothetical protein n=1 Tax=uncultured Parasphingorhabdus sp. TaxID=2709694 RepID=UPI002AA8DB30|nr:hypothetical protein [uncultured Parasphingorhabdus sp.]